MVAERFHAPLISCEPSMKLTHVVERHTHRSPELYPQVTVVRSLEELLQTGVELVVILTPNQSHHSLARQALLAGKHVVIDKPMTVSSEEADDLIRVAEQNRRVLSVFHNRRWDSDFLTLRKLLKEGSLGRLVELESRFDRFRPQPKGGWREEPGAGTGVLFDLGSHLLDQALVLFGAPRAVWADVQSQREGVQADDWFRILLDYPETRVSLRASCLAAGPMVRFTARGTKGSWVKRGLDPQENALADGGRPGSADWGVERASQWGTLYSGQSLRKVSSEAGSYPEYYRLLARAIREGEEPPVPAREARDVIYGLELCRKSAAQRCWVEW